MKARAGARNGDNHSRSKLTAEKVSRSRALLAEDCNAHRARFAREYGVTHATISCIARGRRGANVEAAPAAVGDENGCEERVQ